MIIASELGTRNAAPTPCRQRAATSTQPLGATAHSSDATAKTTSPTRSTDQPAELIGHRARDEDERAEREQVAVDDPLLQGQPAAEFAADRGQREVDHRAVEKGDERGQHRDRDQRPVGVASSVGIGLATPPSASSARVVPVSLGVVRVQRALGGADRQIGHECRDRGQRPAHRDAGDAQPARLVGVVEVVLHDEARREHQHPRERRDVERQHRPAHARASRGRGR